MYQLDTAVVELDIYVTHWLTEFFINLSDIKSTYSIPFMLGVAYSLSSIITV